MSDKYLRDEKQQLLNAIGTEACWGWSPAIDFTEILQERLKLTKTGKHTLLGSSEHENNVEDIIESNNNVDSIISTNNSLKKASNSTKYKESDKLHSLRRKEAKPSTQSASVDELLEDMLGIVKIEHSEGINAQSTNTSHTPKGNHHQQKYEQEEKEKENDVHILMAGACDVRHILRTLSSLKLREHIEYKEEIAKSNNDEHLLSSSTKEKQHESGTIVNKAVNDKSNTSTLESELLSSMQASKEVHTKGEQELQESTDNIKKTVKEAIKAREHLTYHFYLYEPNLRLHCRHLFFLQWLLDSMFALEELEERVLMFLDVYGNACTRDATAAQARSVIQRLLKVLNNNTGTLCEFISMDEMKMKERDFVQEQLLHWVRDSSHVDLSSQWARRVRQEMAERYDNRDNLIDWDFVFKLSDYTNLIKFPEYRTWRNTGIAFDVTHINPRRGFEYNYSVPNKSLCLFDRKGHGVYYGEVKNGPFYSFGAATENKHICHRSADGTCKYGNGVISMHNVRSWLYTLMTGAPWPWADHHFAWDDEKYYNYLPDGTPRTTTYQAHFPRVKFHFVGLDFDRFLLHRSHRQCALFDAAFFGTSCTQLMTRNFFCSAMAREGCVIAETAKFVIDAADEAKEMYVEKIKELALAANWAVNEDLTDQLHKNQPAPRTVQSTQTPAQETAQKRFKMPYQVALTCTPQKHE